MTARSEVDQLASSVIARLAPGLLVRTQEAHFWSTTPDDEALQYIALTAAIDLAADRGEEALQVRTTYKVEALTTDDAVTADVSNASQRGWKCHVTLHGVWNVSGIEKVSDDGLRAFALRVGLMALHPYARAHIQSAVVSSGWPPYTLDVLTAQHDLFVSQESPAEIDLGLIGVG